MNLFRGSSVRSRDLPRKFRAQDIAALSGLSSGRISQLGAAGRLPAPDVEVAGGKPVWSRKVVLAWLASEGREPRVPVSPLLRGEHRRRGTQIVTLPPRQRLWGGGDSGPVRVHVATYATSQPWPGRPAPVFVCVTLAPHRSTELLSIGDVFAQLVEAVAPELLDGGRRGDPNAVLATFVILETNSYDGGRSPGFHAHPQATALDLHENTTREQLSDPLSLTSALTAEEIAEGLGHALPWWPPGCATAEFVGAWAPGGGPVPCPVPPPLQASWRTRGWGHHVAQSLPPDDATAVRAAVDTQWTTQLSDFVATEQPAAGWVHALAIDGDPRPPLGDFVEGLDVLFSGDDLDLHHLDQLQEYFGDPLYATGGAVELAQLSPQLREHVTAAVTAATGPGSRSWRTHRARRLLTADATAATWHAAGTSIPAASTSTHVAFLVPRTAPRVPPDLAKSGAELAITPSTPDPDGRPWLSALLHLDDGAVVPLAAGPAPLLAGTVSWWAWHIDEDLPLPTGVLFSLAPDNSPLRQLAEGIASGDTAPTALPWAAVVALAGPHPTRQVGTWCACSRYSAAFNAG